MYRNTFAGGVGDTLAAQMARDGVEIPQNLADQPTLIGDLLCYLDAFYELDTERAHGVGLVRIPWSAIVRYGRHYGYDVEELVFFIRRMDDAHLDKLRAGAQDGGSTGTGEIVHRPPRPDQ